MLTLPLPPPLPRPATPSAPTPTRCDASSVRHTAFSYAQNLAVLTFERYFLIRTTNVGRVSSCFQCFPTTTRQRTTPVSLNVLIELRTSFFMSSTKKNFFCSLSPRRALLERSTYFTLVARNRVGKMGRYVFTGNKNCEGRGIRVSKRKPSKSQEEQCSSYERSGCDGK